MGGTAGNEEEADTSSGKSISPTKHLARRPRDGAPRAPPTSPTEMCVSILKDARCSNTRVDTATFSRIAVR